MQDVAPQHLACCLSVYACYAYQKLEMLATKGNDARGKVIGFL